MLALFREYFKEIAEAETRTVTLFSESEEGLPPGSYAFVEMFCNHPGCDCRRVRFLVAADWAKGPIAVLGYGWESPAYYQQWIGGDRDAAREMSGLMLERTEKQSKYAPAVMKLFERLLLSDENYIERVKRHYRMMRDAVDGRRSAPSPKKGSSKRKKTSKKTARTKTVEHFKHQERFVLPELVSTETVQNALLSKHEAVRNSASCFFSCCRTDGLSAEIMKTVIRSVELYGRIPSLGMLDGLDVPQDETTVRWLVEELKKDYDLGDCLLDNYCFIISKILCKADPGLLTPGIADLYYFANELNPLFLKRLELAEMDWPSLWQLLLDYASDWEEELEVDGMDIDELLLEAIAHRCTKDEESKKQVLDALCHGKALLDDDEYEELVSFLLKIAAKARITEAREFVIDHIYRNIKKDRYFQEGFREAFASIAEEDDWESLYSRWNQSSTKYPWFLDFVIEKPSRKSLEIVLDIVLNDKKHGSYASLLDTLLENYVKEAHPVIAKRLDSGQDLMESWDELLVALVVSGIINPDSLEDFDGWFESAVEIDWNLDGLTEEYATERLRDTYFGSIDDLDDDDDEFYERIDAGLTRRFSQSISQQKDDELFKAAALKAGIPLSTIPAKTSTCWKRRR